jgi:hypothetical protein
MINAVIHWILQGELSLWIATGLAGAGLALGRFVKGPRAWLFGLGGHIALGAALFLAGYQMADDRAAHQAQVATLKNENARLTRDLGNQKIIAEKADEERKLVLQQIEDRNAKVADYEAKLAEKPQAQACNLTAADLRALRSLRAKPR